MSDSADRVDCDKHGRHAATYVCHHLLGGDGLGFHYGYDPDEPDALYPDAWCGACDAVLEEEGEWNERSEAFADIRLLCAKCYVETRARNWIQDDKAYRGLVSAAVDYLEQRQQSFTREFRIDEYERWDWYQDTGKLVFSDGGRPRVEADIDFVGSVSTKTHSWMWAWANPSLAENIKRRSREMRALGEQNWYHDLASATWPADESDGWEMTALMAQTLGSIGAYRTPGEHGFTFMVLQCARRLDAD